MRSFSTTYFWTDELDKCSADAICVAVSRSETAHSHEPAMHVHKDQDSVQRENKSDDLIGRK